MSEQTPYIAPSLTPSGSLAARYFDQLYARNADPWEFETSSYEAAKYAATLAALPGLIYKNGLELGCSIGVLTKLLALRCARLLATDVSESALTLALARCVDLENVHFECCDLASHFPAGSFDLILVSEVGYYFSASDLETLRGKIARALIPGGHLLLVHFTGETNYPLTADAVHNAFIAWQGRAWTRLKAHREDSYRLDLLVRI